MPMEQREKGMAARSYRGSRARGTPGKGIDTWSSLATRIVDDVPRRTTNVRRHERDTSRGRTTVREHVREIPQRKHSQERRKSGFYYDLLPRDDRTEIARLGYRKQEHDLRGSLTTTGSVRCSGSLDGRTRIGAEHNPASGVTIPYIERKRRSCDRR